MDIKKKIYFSMTDGESTAVNTVCNMFAHIVQECVDSEMRELNDDTNALWNQMCDYFRKWEEK